MTNWNCLKDFYQNCADDNPDSFLKFCPCACAEDLVIYICNSNHVTDDNFEVRLNGTVIGNLDLITDNTPCIKTNPECEFWDYDDGPCPYPDIHQTDSPGGWWSSLPSLGPYDLGKNAPGGCDPDNAPELDELYSCCLDGMTIFGLDNSLIRSGENVIEMSNTQDNGYSNFGNIGIYKVSNTGYICEILREAAYTGGPEADFNFSFEWTGRVPSFRARTFKKGNILYVDKEHLQTIHKIKMRNKAIQEKQEYLKNNPPIKKEIQNHPTNIINKINKDCNCRRKIKKDIKMQ